MTHKAVVVLSGGLDSTVALYDTIAKDNIVTSAVSFNYGQRHKKELEYAAAIAGRVGIKHHVIDLWRSGLTEALSTSASSLITDTEVPEGHYGEESMKATVVPNRNMIMLSIAGGIAVAEGAHVVVTGVHAGDHFIYPDCRPNFINAASLALNRGNEGFGNLKGIAAPFLNKTKDDIAYRALELQVPLDWTWSCYKGGAVHCGRCGTCVERLEAINNAVNKWNKAETDIGTGNYVADRTVYEDNQFWLSAIEKGI